VATCFRFNQQGGPTAIDVHDKFGNTVKIPRNFKKETLLEQQN